MKFSNHIKRKTKPKLLLLSLLLTLSMIVPTFTTQTLQVQATEKGKGQTEGVKNKVETGTPPVDEKKGTETDTTGGDSTQQNSPDANQYFPNWDKTGWLFYVCDSNRQLLTDVVFIRGTNRTYGKSYDETYLTSRIGNQRPSRFLPPFDFGAPVTDKGSNWKEVKKYLDKDGLKYVQKVFGDDIVKEVESNPKKVHVILETVSWHYKSDRSSSKAVASCSGWARMVQEGKCKIGEFSWFPFHKIAVSEYLEYQWPGLEPPPPSSIHPVNNALSSVTGWGMQLPSHS